MHRVRQLLAATAAIVLSVFGYSVGVGAAGSPSRDASSSRTGSPGPVAATFSVSPTSGPANSEFTLTGSGFPPNGAIDVYLDDRSHALNLYEAAYPNGTISILGLRIMGSPGLHTLCAYSYSVQSRPVPEVTACASLGLTDFQPTITLYPSSGLSTTTVTVTGSGFPSGELVALYVNSPTKYLSTPGPRADQQGGFVFDVVLAGHLTTAGPQKICGDTGYPGSTQQYATKACATFVTASGVPTSTLGSGSVTSGSTASTPAAAVTTASGVPLWPIALGLVLAIIGIGASAFLRIRRRP
jgi:hypothetical protein